MSPASLEGILLFNKPILWTSHDAVDFVRRCTGLRAVGHTGTLDPLATGLLVLLLGKATKLSDRLTGMDKDYAGTMTLGVVTDTQDLEGKILRVADSHEVSEKEARTVFAGLLGEQQQAAPAFSAVRKNGKKLYQLTRKGVSVEPVLRPINIKELHLTRFEPPDLHFALTCSKGTYVRALCDRAGELLGCGAVLSSLVRTRVGPFHLKDAATEEALKNFSTLEFQKKLLSGEAALAREN